jgi:hypothetical protein
MNPREKDNLTDIVENVPQMESDSGNSSNQSEQEVVNDSGESITLGNEEGGNRAI